LRKDLFGEGEEREEERGYIYREKNGL